MEQPIDNDNALPAGVVDDMESNSNRPINNNPDTERKEDTPGHSDASTHGASNSTATQRLYMLLTVIGFVWGIVMTILYVQERNSPTTTTDNPPNEDTTTIRNDNVLGMAAVSHINVIVNDSIDIGAAYYQEILGFKPAENADGPMHYTNITNYGFCVDAGFENGDCRVDIIFLKHPIMNLYLELFKYYEPNDGNQEIQFFNTHDVGGIRHIAVEVEDAVGTYDKLKASNHQGQFITKETPIPLDPFPYTFFYWIDKYGTQWEFEQGRPVEYYHIAGITG